MRVANSSSRILRKSSSCITCNREIVGNQVERRGPPAESGKLANVIYRGIVFYKQLAPAESVFRCRDGQISQEAGDALDGDA